MRRSSQRRDEFLSFCKLNVRDVLAEFGERVDESVRRISDARLASANEEQLAAEVAAQHKLVVPHLAFEEIHAEYGSRMIPAEHFPISYAVERGRSYEKKTVIFRIPYEGEPIFLQCHDSTYSLSPARIFLDQGDVCFEILELSMDKDRIEQEKDRAVGHLQKYLPAVAYSVSSYNERLPGRTLALIHERKKEIEADSDLLAALGAKVRPALAAPAAMSVTPPVKRRVIRVAHTPLQPGRTPDPTLDAKTYEDILQALHGYGVQMERSPSTYTGMGEEDIRNHILALLQAGFEGSATGESFNRSGRTDLLLRHQNRNLFVAECKVWSGAKAYAAAITQLLGYLTWRESKAALLLFVRNREISTVLTAIREASTRHPQFVRLESSDQGMFRYCFALPPDLDVHIYVAVLAFHLV